MSKALSEPRNYAKERAREQAEEERQLEAVSLFHGFLQGEIPEGTTGLRKFNMSPDKAMQVIWVLQECCHLLSDRFEMCHTCKTIYDAHSEGAYVEKTGRTYCDSCDPRPY